MIDNNVVTVVNPTGNVYKQENKSVPGFIPEIEQLYFEMGDKDHTFLLGLKDLLECLAFSIRMGEIPPLPASWVAEIRDLYGIEPESWYGEDK